MSTFAVTYVYDDRHDERNAHRPAHRAFLGGLFAAGIVLASGPVTDSELNGALIIVKAESSDAVTTLLAADPFAQHGLIAATAVAEWTVVLGPWSD